MPVKGAAERQTADLRLPNPGRFRDLNVFILNRMDHGIGTLSACRIVDIPRDRILEMTQRLKIARALMCATLVDEATLREWLVNIGQRDAEHRIAHLFREVHLRLKCVGLADGGEFELMVFKLVMAASRTWRRLKGENQLPNLIAGVGSMTGPKSPISSPIAPPESARHPESLIAPETVRRTGFQHPRMAQIGLVRARPQCDVRLVEAARVFDCC